MSRIRDLAAQFDDRMPAHDEDRYRRQAAKRRQVTWERKREASRKQSIADTLAAGLQHAASDPFRKKP